MLFDKIRPLYFFAAFAFGLFLCYIYTPKPEVVMKFPSPYNAGNITYKDKGSNCYKYEATKSECPKDKALIKDQPVHEDFKAKKIQ